MPALLVFQLTIAAPQLQAGLFGSKHLREYRQQRDAANKLLKQGKSKDALGALMAAHQILEQSGKKDSYLEESFTNLGKFHAAHGSWYAAEGYFNKCVAAVEDRRGTNHIETARAYFVHGQVLNHLHRFAKAERLLQRAEYTARWKLGRYSVGAGYCKAVLGQVSLNLNRNQEAAEYLAGGLKQMGSFKRFTRVEDGLASNGWELAEFDFKPTPKDQAMVMVDYATALLRLNHKSEAEKVLAEARALILSKLKKVLPDFFIRRRMALAAEAIGDLAAAEKHFYKAAELAYANPSANEDQKLGANKMLYAFHIRHDQQIKASTQESILFNKMVPDNVMQWLVLTNEQLAAARTAR